MKMRALFGAATVSRLRFTSRLCRFYMAANIVSNK